MESQELYEVLGLQPFADGAMVDQAYWHLAKSFQTLAITDPRARQSLDALNDAYGVLGTPRLREEYDETLRNRGTHAPRRDSPEVQARKRSFSLKALFSRKEEVAEPTEAAAAVLAPTVAIRPAPAPAVRSKRSAAGVQDLQASTGAMLERWRANARIETSAPGQGVAESSPDTTLVDIFRTEQAVDDENGPLNAVMDVLRSSKESAPASS